MKKTSFDFDLSSTSTKNNKKFAEKLQIERKQRSETKKATSAAKIILFYYLKSNEYAKLSQNVQKDYMIKIQDLLKIESLVKEKFPLLALAAIEKYGLLRISLLITKNNGEKYINLLENLAYLIMIVQRKTGNFFNKDTVNRKIYMKRLILGILGIISRNKKNIISDRLFEFLEFSLKIKNLLATDFKLMLNLLKKKEFFIKPDILTPLFKKQIKKLLLSSKIKNIEKNSILSEILEISNGVQDFLPKKYEHFFDYLTPQIENILKKKTKIEPINVLENLVTILMNIILKQNDISESMFKLFIQAFNQILDILTKNHEFAENDMMIEVEEVKGDMEIEYELPDFELKKLNPKIWEIFFNDEFISFVSKKMKSDFDNRPIINSEDWDIFRYVCHLYTNLLGSKTKDKAKFLRKLSFNSEFIEMLFKIFETFNFKIVQNQIGLFADIINLFSRLYYHKLILMDEMEFYSQKSPFPSEFQQNSNENFLQNFAIEKIINLSSFLNEFVFQNFFFEQQKSFQKCKHSTIKLLQELYNRHSLRSFTSERNFWIIPKANQLPNISAIIKEIPFVLKFEARITQMNKFMTEDKNEAKRDDFGDLEVIEIRRGQEIDDGFDKFNSIDDLRNMIRIKYVNEHGMEEIGIDGGGILKEYLTTVCKQAFDPNYGLFKETDERTYRPNPYAEVSQPGKSKGLFNFLGKVVGKALYENILIEPVFARSFLNSLLGRKNGLNDLESLDRGLYKSLLYLKHAENEEIIKELGLTFSLIEDNGFGKLNVIELKPDGANIDVRKDNRLEFIELLIDYKLNKQTQTQVKAFLAGFQEIILLDWLKMFNQDELQILISGSKGFDVNDLKNNCILKGFGSYDNTVNFLWETLESFTTEEKQLFLFFATSCSRPPLLGFESLQPPFCIQKADYGGMYYGEDETDRLPTSSTCMNILRLPDYGDKVKLKNKLLYAIKAKSGFDLS